MSEALIIGRLELSSLGMKLLPDDEQGNPRFELEDRDLRVAGIGKNTNQKPKAFMMHSKENRTVRGDATHQIECQLVSAAQSSMDTVGSAQ